MFEKNTFRELPQHFLTEIYMNGGLKRELAQREIDPEDLAIFLHPEGELELRVVDFHHRSVDVPMKEPVVHRKKDHSHVYCSFDVKGVGFLKPETHASKKDGIERGELAGYPSAYITSHSKETPWGYDALGLFDERMAMTTVKKSEELSALGMRVEAFVALYRLDRVYVDGEVTTLSALKREAAERFMQERADLKATIKSMMQNRTRPLLEEEILPIRKQIEQLEVWKDDMMRNFSPVIGIRLMKSVFRIRDLQDATPAQARIMLEEAVANLQTERRLLHQEETVPEFTLSSVEGREAYLTQLAKWFGEGLGILMKTGQSHLFLHMGNLSLAGEIVDLDSVSKVLRTRQGKVSFGDGANVYTAMHEEYHLPNCLIKDMRDIVFSLKKLVQALRAQGYDIRKTAKEQIVHASLAGFTKALGTDHEPYQAIHVTNQRLCEVFGSILERILISGEHMSPLPQDDSAK